MRYFVDLLAIWGVLALLVTIAGASIAVRRIRRANIRLATIRSGYNVAAGERAAGEEATPSPYTIPRGPST